MSDASGTAPQSDPNIVAVEWALIAHPAVLEAAALAGTVTAGAPLRVYIVLQDGATGDDALCAALAGWVEQNLGDAAPPLEFLFVESLPKTRTGKVARWMLGEQGG